MQPDRFDRIVVNVIAGLLAAIALVWVGWRYFGVAPPHSGHADGLVSAYGPLVVEFDQPVDAESAQQQWSIEPAVTGEFRWKGTQLQFWPDWPLESAQTYQVKVAAGVQTDDGRQVRQDAQWSVQVRRAQLLFLSPSQDAEIWVNDMDGGSSRQLTNTGGRVYDYAVDASGSFIVYAAQNAQGGASLWRIEREGGEADLLLDCGEDWCINPAIASRTGQLAYARRTAGITPGSAPGIPRIWMMDLASGTTRQLYDNPAVSGSEPLFSADGAWLIFHDGLEQQLRLVQLSTEQEILLPSSAGKSAAWAPEGLAVYYNDVLVEESLAYGALYRFEPMTKQIDRLFADLAEPVNEGQAAFSPDGRWMLLARGEPQSNARRQLWLVDRQTDAMQPVTNDPLVSIGAYLWSPDSDQAAIQVLTFGTSNARPMIQVWQRTRHTFTTVAEDAAAAQWLP